MERLSYSARCAMLVDMIKRLREKGSWCGETHVQKAMYIAQDVGQMSLGYKFILYKHGPFSFDLKEELSAMRASNMIELTFCQQDYGPSIVPTEFGERVWSVNVGEIDRLAQINGLVADWIADSDVRKLERIATAYYVTRKYPRAPVSERAKQIVGLKPHVDLTAAEEAVRWVDQKRSEALLKLQPAA